MEAAKLLAAEFLSRHGFHVEEIPVGEGKSADLRFTDDSATYHVEVKEKFESEEDAKTRKEILSRGEMFEPQPKKLSSDNRISGILAQARKQLDATPKDSGTFQLIWFHSHGFDADLKYRQAFATFYGDVPVSSRRPHPEETKHCFYFDYSAALVMPTIEALVLCDGKQVQVCLNESSRRAGEFRTTGFYKKFLFLDAIFDPVALESAGEVIFCRAEIARKNEAEIVSALQAQTGVLYTPHRLNRYTFTIADSPPGPYLDDRKKKG
jgi:hypothetical protein